MPPGGEAHGRDSLPRPSCLNHCQDDGAVFRVASHFFCYLISGRDFLETAQISSQPLCLQAEPNYICIQKIWLIGQTVAFSGRGHYFISSQSKASGSVSRRQHVRCPVAEPSPLQTPTLQSSRNLKISSRPKLSSSPRSSAGSYRIQRLQKWRQSCGYPHLEPMQETCLFGNPRSQPLLQPP